MDIRRTSGKIAAYFLVFGLLWIFLSDYLVAQFVEEEVSKQVLFQTAKGVVFVLLTTMLIYFISNNQMGRKFRLLGKLHQHTKLINEKLSDIPGTDFLVLSTQDEILSHAGSQFADSGLTKVGMGKPVDIIEDKELRCIISGSGKEIFEKGSAVRQFSLKGKWYEVRGGVLAQANEIYGAVMAIIDITEQKQQAQELEDALTKAQESDRLTTAFMQNLSHEIRTPLNGIIGFTSLLAKQHTEDGQQKNFLHIIQNSSYQLLGIIQDIITISEIQAGVLRIYPDYFFLDKLMERLREDFSQESQKNPAIEFEVAAAPHTKFHTDYDKVREIASKLLHNAFKYTSTGKVCVRAWAEEEKLHLRVLDTGVGIDQNKRPRIFKDFWQLETSLSKTAGGLGLGLSIVKGYLEALNGQIHVTSSLGKGSEFQVTLPELEPNAKDGAARARYN